MFLQYFDPRDHAMRFQNRWNERRFRMDQTKTNPIDWCELPVLRRTIYVAVSKCFKMKLSRAETVLFNTDI